jgi:inorganic triphosphatase YgiF
MKTEVELKLSLPAGALRRAERLAWLRKLATEVVPPKRLVSDYFDTKKLKLRERGVALRIRRIGSRRLQTIKGRSAAGALGRFEREDEITSKRPRPKYPKGTPFEKLVAGKLRKKLRPVFRTDVRRSAIRVRLNGSDIELAFDRGAVVVGRRSEPIHELELELKKGRAEDVAALARRLHKTIPVAFEARAKADRGYALSKGEQGGPVYAAPISLTRDQSAGAAFGQIGLACLQHLAANQNAVIAGDPEGVHQMRVGLRRLRAIMSLFRGMMAGHDAEEIKRELKWLTGELGPARDLDVMTKEAIAPLRESNPDKPEIALLERDVKRDRSDEFERAGKAVSSPRFHELVLKTVLWLIDGEWTRASGLAAELRARAISSAAADILEHRSRKIRKRTKRLDKLDARHRHKLRIAIKKLRYGCGFFQSLFGHRKTQRRYGHALKELQGCLGKLNDIRVHAEKGRRLASARRREPGRVQKAYAMGFLTGREQASARRFVSAAARAGRRLVHSREFW